jgi:hypothetical protein
MRSATIAVAMRCSPRSRRQVSESGRVSAVLRMRRRAGSAVVAGNPNYCRWLSKQPFVRRELPALYTALKTSALPEGGMRSVRVERRTIGSCEVYTFPAERLVRIHRDWI